jgi:hypothetical protein
MNRTLKRPMFRIGGSAGTGITSGLDTPRKQYNEGTDPYDRALKTTQRAMQDLEKFRGKRSGFMPGSLSSFLTSTGLNLLSATPQGSGFGGLLSTAAKSAQQPFQTFQAARMAEEDDRVGRAEDLFSGALASEYDILEQKEKAKTGSATEYAKSQAADALGKIYETDIANVQAKIDKLDPTADADMIKEYEQDIQNLKRQLKTDQKAIFLGADTDQEYQREVILKLLQAGEDIEDILEYFPDAATIMGPGFKLPEEEKEGAKDGGRIGLKEGTPMMESIVEQEKEQGEVQDLSYTQLRSRLPQEISNEIVMLLANSKQALLDFANIQTTQDIQGFNQQYDVNLTLPQGA